MLHDYSGTSSFVDKSFFKKSKALQKVKCPSIKISACWDRFTRFSLHIRCVTKFSQIFPLIRWWRAAILSKKFRQKKYSKEVHNYWRLNESTLSVLLSLVCHWSNLTTLLTFCKNVFLTSITDFWIHELCNTL